MSRGRRRFYLALAVTFPLFFLLHWNGLLWPFYYWALVALNGTENTRLTAAVAFVSSIVVFSALALVFEGVRALRRPR